MSTQDVEYRDHGRKRLEAAIAKLEGLEVRIGFQGRTGLTEVKARRRVSARRNGRKRGSEARSSSKIRLVDLATIHEFGSPKANIPERSFLRATLQNNPAKVRSLMRAVVKRAIDGRSTSSSILREAARMGLTLEAAVKKTITDLRSPPLAESTKRARYLRTGDRDPNPLVDTGQLRAGVTFEVRLNGRRVGGSG